MCTRESVGNLSLRKLIAGYKHARPEGDGESCGSGRQKKARVSYEHLDVKKDLSSWKKEELEIYLSQHHITKTGNKPELLRRVIDHMKAAVVDQ